MYFKIKVLSEKCKTNVGIDEIFLVFSSFCHYTELCFQSGYKGKKRLETLSLLVGRTLLQCAEILFS